MDETLEELIERVKPKEINGTIQEVNEHNPPLLFKAFEYIAENHDF